MKNTDNIGSNRCRLMKVNHLEIIKKNIDNRISCVDYSIPFY